MILIIENMEQLTHLNVCNQAYYLQGTIRSPHRESKIFTSLKT